MHYLIPVGLSSVKKAGIFTIMYCQDTNLRHKGDMNYIPPCRFLSKETKRDNLFPLQISRNLFLLQTLSSYLLSLAMSMVDGGSTQHPYLGQETASPGQGEILLSDLSLVLGLGRTGGISLE
jgi:hypothetical protein